MKYYYKYYLTTFLLGCIAFHVICRHNLRLRVIDWNAFLVHNLLQVGSIFILALFVNHYLWKRWNANKLLNYRLRLILLLLALYLVFFYSCAYIIQQLPIHFAQNRASHIYDLPTNNILYFETNPFQFFPIFIWIGSLFILIIPIEVYYKNRVRFFEQQKHYHNSNLSLLRMRMNPHFLFNELNNIYALSVLNEKNYYKYLDSSIDLIKLITDNGQQDTCTLASEIKSILKYISSQQIKHNHKVKIYHTFPENIAGITIPNMVLLTLVENAFKHYYLDQNIEGYHVLIYLTIDDKQLEFQINNTYRGGRLIKSGVGLKQLRKRLETYYQNNFSLTQEAEPNGYYKVVLIIRYED